MTSSEKVILALVALALTLGTVELARREIANHRRSGQRWWRIDASAAGAFFNGLAALGAWTSLALDRPPTLAMIVAYVGVMMFLLLADARTN